MLKRMLKILKINVLSSVVALNDNFASSPFNYIKACEPWVVSDHEKSPRVVDNVDATKPKREATSEESSYAPLTKQACDKKNKILADEKSKSCCKITIFYTWG